MINNFGEIGRNLMLFAIEIDWDECNGCGACYEVCPSDCFGKPVEGKAVLIEENRKYCMGCRGCESQCPKEAISIIEL
jgi:NAD-dependent dihydropyrimidine dehydrogenase PreA subunit